MPEWQELTLRTHAPEAVAEVLEACDAVAVTFKDAADNPVLEPLPGTTPLWSQTLVVGLFAATEARTEIEERLQRGAGPWIISAHWDTLPEQVWERAWLSHFQPMAFGRRLRVAPHAAICAGDDRVTLRLDPGLAFGTGTHPSTALCLEWLGDANLRGQSVLDFGCGSGILGIAAALLGADCVRACDIDTQALTATADNAQRNGVQIDLIATADAAQQSADVVLANILAGTLIALATTLTRCTRPGGTILLAGLLSEQATAVAEAFPAFSFIRRDRDNWSLLVGCRNSTD